MADELKDKNGRALQVGQRVSGYGINSRKQFEGRVAALKAGQLDADITVTVLDDSGLPFLEHMKVSEVEGLD